MTTASTALPLAENPSRTQESKASFAALAPAARTREATAPQAAESAKPGIQLRRISKTFEGEAGPVQALHDVELHIRPGEFVTLLGASGCGKTTLLRIIGGLERSYQGEALLDGKPIAGPGRDRGFVFQDHRLLPWLTIAENVGFGLAHLSKAERNEIVQTHLKLVGLESFARSYPSQLSGGMAQRASIARSLATDPSILLLDEPLGALDALTRMYMQEEIEKIWKSKPGLAVVMVTHDVDEALYLSDRVVVLSPRPGRIRQILEPGLARPRPREGRDFNVFKKLLLEEFHLSHRHEEPEFSI